MKKFLLIIVLLVSLSQPKQILGWNDCPKGLINDPYPGVDSNYIDTNNDEICDHSQSAIATDYHLIPILFSLILLYSVSLLLAKKNILNLSTHRKIWNIFLLISFLGCGISGILLILRLNFGLNLPNYAGTLFNHVEFGIAITAVAFFHILWHLNYFKNVFKNNQKK